ncbi:MAG: CPBP family intramembrane glutamic endopeptidase [Gammaproteobacteria bacterium]
MSSFVIFCLVVIGALLSGATMAYQLYILITFFTEISFPDVIIASTQFCGLIFSLLYLKFISTLDLKTIGLQPFRNKQLRMAGWGFIAGLIIILMLAMSLLITNVYGFHVGRDTTISKILVLLISALATGIIVSVFEEIVFRGALLQGLYKNTSVLIAVISTSIIYALLHFIDYPDTADGEVINFFTALSQFIPAYSNLLSIENYDAFLTLFILGVLFAMIRIKTNSIIQCIFLHAGIVAGIKLFRYFLVYTPNSTYDFIVSSHDHRLGFMAIFWIALATVLYYFIIFRKHKNNSH